MIGEIVAGYRLEKLLGAGATGTTYLGARSQPDRGACADGIRAVVKLLHQPLTCDRVALDGFFAEARAASQVNHVGIADVLDCGTDGGRAYLVTELLAGKTLGDALVELGAVADVGSLADIGWQLATMLAAAHEQNLMHGTLTPNAIFLTFPPEWWPRPLVKTIDFGMRWFSAGVKRDAAGTLVGPAVYRSPEIAREPGSLDPRADVYLLGCVLFELACGRPPFVCKDEGELVIAHASETAPSVCSVLPSFPRTIDALVGRMLAKDPVARPRGMVEVAVALSRALDGAASSDSPSLRRAPRAKRQAPTALLPLEAAPPSPSATSWITRVHQRSTLIEPPAMPHGREPSPPPSPPPSRKPAAKSGARGRRRTPRAAAHREVRVRRDGSSAVMLVSLVAAVLLTVTVAVLAIGRRSRPAPSASPPGPVPLLRPPQAPQAADVAPAPSVRPAPELVEPMPSTVDPRNRPAFVAPPRREARPVEPPRQEVPAGAQEVSPFRPPSYW